MLPLCLAAAFLLPDTQINPATNKKITAQNYCPPCQLGKLPSSRISMDILAPVPKTSSNSVPQLIKSHNQKLSAHSKSDPPNPSSVESPSRKPSSFPYSSFTDSCKLLPQPPPCMSLLFPLMFYLLGIHRLPLCIRNHFITFFIDLLNLLLRSLNVICS
jgi:hypothetical protein